MCGKRLKRALPLWLPHYEPLLEDVLAQSIIDECVHYFVKSGRPWPASFFL